MMLSFLQASCYPYSTCFPLLLLQSRSLHWRHEAQVEHLRRLRATDRPRCKSAPCLHSVNPSNGHLPLLTRAKRQQLGRSNYKGLSLTWTALYVSKNDSQLRCLMLVPIYHKTFPEQQIANGIPPLKFRLDQCASTIHCALSP